LHLDLPWITLLGLSFFLRSNNRTYTSLSHQNKKKDCVNCFPLQYEELNEYGGPDVRAAAGVFRFFVGPPENLL